MVALSGGEALPGGVTCVGVARAARLLGAPPRRRAKRAAAIRKVDRKPRKLDAKIALPLMPEFQDACFGRLQSDCECGCEWHHAQAGSATELTRRSQCSERSVYSAHAALTGQLWLTLRRLESRAVLQMRRAPAAVVISVHGLAVLLASDGARSAGR